MIFSSFFLLIATRYSRCLKPSSSLSLFLNIKISYGILFNLQFQPLNKSLWQQGRIVHTSFSLQDFTSLIECFMHIYFYSSFILLISLLKIWTKTLSFKWTTSTKYIPHCHSDLPSSLFDVHAQGPHRSTILWYHASNCTFAVPCTCTYMQVIYGFVFTPFPPDVPEHNPWDQIQSSYWPVRLSLE